MKHLISYCKRLYSRSALQEAVDAFGESFQIAFLGETEDAYVLDFGGVNDPERAVCEFDNYVIGIENRVGIRL